MSHKNKEDRNRYMREYRQRIKETVSLEGKALEAKLEEYKKDGLDKNNLFMDTVYALAMKGNNAKYADLYWRMVKPEPEPKEEQEMTAAETIQLGIELVNRLKESYQEGGLCPVCGISKPLADKLKPKGIHQWVDDGEQTG